MQRIRPAVFHSGLDNVTDNPFHVKYTIQAFAKFVESGGEGELHIYGDGPLRSELESLAMSLSTNVSFHGNVPNAEVLATLDSADVLIHSSFREGGSWTILEAMAHGVPVICQNRAGMKDMVTTECGIKIMTKTPEGLINGLVQALIEYYDNPEKNANDGCKSQQRVAARYTWKKIVDTIDSVYSEVVNRS